MAQIIIRKLPEQVKQRLKERAAHHGRSMEEEARAILTRGLAAPEPEPRNLYDSVRAIVDPIGGFELNIERDKTPYVPPDLSDWDIPE